MNWPFRCRRAALRHRGEVRELPAGIFAWRFHARRALAIGVMILAAAALALSGLSAVGAEKPPPPKPKTEEDLAREAASAEFTRKMKEANYLALFEKAAQEFNVPADILKGVAFAETRWEHLTWPPGQNYSPETGMPRPYGIMSLWSNEFFGLSLIEAASLIGKDPEELKADPHQNIRGGAALLRKLYDQNPKPPGTAEQDIESWRYAIVKYCGIPEPDLSHQHGLDVYEFMNRGYHQYGIEWDARPVNLGPMREEVKRIKEEERMRQEARRQAELAAQTALGTGAVAQAQTQAQNRAAVADQKSGAKLPAQAAAAGPASDALPQAGDKDILRWVILAGAVLVLLAGYFAYRRQAQTPT